MRLDKLSAIVLLILKGDQLLKKLKKTLWK